MRILRADSQFYNAGVIAACRRAGASFSITTGMNPSIKWAVLSIPNDPWQKISYPKAVEDPDTGDLISDAETPAYTAFASRKKSERVTARLIVRQARDLAKPAVVGEQGELFPVWRYHPFFTDNPRRDTPGRTGTPPPRGGGTGHRGQQSRRSGPPALRALPRQLGLAHAVGHGLQPAAGRRSTHLGLPREGNHRHTPGPPGPRPGPDRPLRTAHHPAPAAQLALAASLDAYVRHHARPTGADLTPLSTPPSRPDRNRTRGKAGQTNRYHRAGWSLQPGKITYVRWGIPPKAQGRPEPAARVRQARPDPGRRRPRLRTGPRRPARRDRVGVELAVLRPLGTGLGADRGAAHGRDGAPGAVRGPGSRHLRLRDRAVPRAWGEKRDHPRGQGAAPAGPRGHPGHRYPGRTLSHQRFHDPEPRNRFTRSRKPSLPGSTALSGVHLPKPQGHSSRDLDDRAGLAQLGAELGGLSFEPRPWSSWRVAQDRTAESCSKTHQSRVRLSTCTSGGPWRWSS